MRILIVHRREVVGSYWARSLERDGAQTKVVTTGHQAIKELRFQPVDAVVLDLSLPGRGAFEVSDYISIHAPDLPVIVIASPQFNSAIKIFDLVPNARHVMNMSLHLGDLAAVIEYYGPRSRDHLLQKRA